MTIRSLQALTAPLVVGALLLASTSDGYTVDGSSLSVSIVSASGYAGHAFVYAQVTDRAIAYPAPTGAGHQSPYYAQWTRQPFGSASCPWIWAVYVFDRATDRQINPAPPNAPQPNFGTATSMCATPSATPVAQVPVPEATARLDLDLTVAISPSQPVAGVPATLTALLSGTLLQDLNLYLNMAITDWSVSRWAVDFGDGSSASIAGKAPPNLRLSHTYTATGTFDARVLAVITGNAQAAAYDAYGAVQLVNRPFTVEIANDTLASARSVPVRSYVPPQGVVAVNPGLDGRPPGPMSFRRVDVMRGALTTFWLRVWITREGFIRMGAASVGSGKSTLVRWRYNGGPTDAPAGGGTKPGQLGAASDPMRLQWNQPDRLSGNQPKDYAVPITLYVETRFPDGHMATYAIDSSFSVTVDFAAQSG